MATYKHYWTKRYRENAQDWPQLVKWPLFDPEGKWTYGAPITLEGEINDAMVLAMGEAPRELVQMKIERAKAMVDAIDRVDLFNTDPRHARLVDSKIKYLRSKSLAGLMEGKTLLTSEWRELALLHIRLFEVLKQDGTPAFDEKLHAALYLLLAHEYAKAEEVLDSMRSVRSHELEFSALKAMAAEVVAHGTPLHSTAVRIQVLDYFDQMRDPSQPYKKFEKSVLDKFEWALLIGEAIDPGDGYLDARRALERVSG